MVLHHLPRQVTRADGEGGLLDALPKAAWLKAWNVNSQAVGDSEVSIKYFAPYVFRVAMSDHHRILKVAPESFLVYGIDLDTIIKKTKKSPSGPGEGVLKENFRQKQAGFGMRGRVGITGSLRILTRSAGLEELSCEDRWNKRNCIQKQVV